MINPFTLRFLPQRRTQKRFTVSQVNSAPANTALVNTALVNTALVNTALVNTALVNTAPRSRNFIILVLLFIGGCSSLDLIPSDSLIQRLKGRGPVLVSPDNPYLAANLLLEQETKHSKEMAGFLSTKGQPTALAVTQKFLEPARIELYYKLGNEQYDLELLQGIWVIKGPGTVRNQTAKELLSTLEPVLLSPTEPSREAISPEAPKESSSRNLASNRELENQEAEPIQHNLVPLFEEPLAAKTVRADLNAPQKSGFAGNSEDNSTADTLDIFVKYPSSPAETTPRGDIVHYVTSEDETLELIALWYSKNAATISRIARANKLSASAPLSPGDQVIIPAGLVKNTMRLPEEALAELKAKP